MLQRYGRALAADRALREAERYVRGVLRPTWETRQVGSSTARFLTADPVVAEPTDSVDPLSCNQHLSASSMETFSC